MNETDLLIGLLVLAALPTAFAIARFFPRFSGWLLGPAMLVGAAMFLGANSRALFGPSDSWTGIGTVVVMFLWGVWCLIGVVLTVTGFMKARRLPARHISGLQSHDPAVTHLSESNAREFRPRAGSLITPRLLLIAVVVIQLLVWLFIAM